MTKIGCSVEEIDTPALLIDLDVMERNIETMAERFRGMPSDLRPHVKTHKTPIIAHKQIEAGAIGVTCAKLGEAEVMAEAGIRSLLIANQIVGEPKVTRLMGLARHSDVIVAVEDSVNVRHLAEKAREKGVKLGVLIEVDVGNNRTGTLPGEPSLELAREVQKYSSLNLKGVMGYEGFCQFIPDMATKRVKTTEAMNKLVSSAHLLEGQGIEVEIVSGGGTGTHMITGNHPGVTEVEAGSYVVMDARYSTLEGLEDFGKALTVLSTVMSTSHEGKVICDAGLKTLTFEFGNPPIKGRPEMSYQRPNEEHGHIDVESGASVKLGEKIEIIPIHCCTNTNLYDAFHCIRDGHLEAIWRIQGRGRSQ
ncbi:MAG: DSD1 family PLP-dependent enzyme [Candidatus Bathyarchaeota archaeon]|nr:DSD1 family PLP-dependent enzyme [Candidatus Bathyarchaeota archaeon]